MTVALALTARIRRRYIWVVGSEIHVTCVHQALVRGGKRGSFAGRRGSHEDIRNAVAEGRRSSRSFARGPLREETEHEGLCD